MSRVAVLTDSNSGITQAAGKELGVGILPMPFFIDGEEYFEEIMIFEKKKAEMGLFMPDQAVETVIGQCRAFLEMGNGNYLYSTFADRVM